MKRNWNTEFNEVKNEMTHTFENGVTVIANRNFGIAVVAVNGDPINSFDYSEMNAYSYDQFLINTSKQAEAINQV